MNYLLDTNIVSDLAKRSPYPKLIEWAKSIDPASMYISVLTIAELHYGVERMRTAGHPVTSVQDMAQKVRRIEDVYAKLIMPFDHAAAHFWGKIYAHYSHLPVALDAQIAAIALARGMTLVTRDNDFWEIADRIAPHGISLQLFNPFAISAA